MIPPTPAGEEGAVQAEVAALGHLLRGEQHVLQGPDDRLRQDLGGPRNNWLRHAQEFSDRRLHNVMAQVDQSRLQRPGQAQDQRTPLNTRIAQPDEQLVELIIGQSRDILHSDDASRELMAVVF